MTGDGAGEEVGRLTCILAQILYSRSIPSRISNPASCGVSETMRNLAKILSKRVDMELKCPRLTKTSHIITLASRLGILPMQQHKENTHPGLSPSFIDRMLLISLTVWPKDPLRLYSRVPLAKKLRLGNEALLLH